MTANDQQTSIEMERYRDFARDTYSTTRGHIETALQGAVSELPVLVIVGESHLDTQQERDANSYTADHMEEPALAAAFTEISALEAAARLVGRENVVLSVETFPDKFAQKVEAIKENGGYPPAPFDQMPIWHTLAYAVNNGFEIVASDTGNNLHETDPDMRDEMMIDAITAISASSDSRPQIVVHVGGSQHISNMLGYTNDEIIDAQGRVDQDNPNVSPFTGFYGYILAYNTTRDTLQTKAERGINPAFGIHTGKEYPDYRASEGGQRITSESRFYEDPDNAYQIYAPGAMDQQVQQNLGEMVREAAMNYRPDNAPQADPSGQDLKDGTILIAGLK